MKSTLKGMIAGIAMSLTLLSLYSTALHAEWFNSKSPLSDSSTLQRIADSLEKMNTQIEELIQIEKQRLQKETEEDRQK